MIVTTVSEPCVISAEVKLALTSASHSVALVIELIIRLAFASAIPEIQVSPVRVKIIVGNTEPDLISPSPSSVPSNIVPVTLILVDSLFI